MKKENNNEMIKELSQFEDEILDLIDDADEIPRSDLQGAVAAIVKNIYTTSIKLRAHEI